VDEAAEKKGKQNRMEGRNNIEQTNLESGVRRIERNEVRTRSLNDVDQVAIFLI
jgi:hypothetical protein